MNDEKRAMIKLVNDVDAWSQENDKYVEKQLEQLYSGNEGWKGVLESRPAAFYRAYAVALDNQERAGV